MNQQPIVQMADILPPPETVDGSIPIWIFLLVILVAIILVGLFLKRLRSPLLQLSWQLKRDTLSTRTACHHLAQLIKQNKLIADHDIQHELDLMRFRPRPPGKEQVLKVIQRIQRHA